MKKCFNCFLSILLSFIIACGTVSTGAFAVSDTWNGTVSSGFDSGTGTSSDPYIIRTGEQLAYLSDSVRDGQTYFGKYFKLAGNIALNDTSDHLNWKTTAPENSWRAIGSYENSFKGTFDGDGYTVSGIYIYNSSDYQGLFGSVNGGTVKNLTVEKSYINGGNYVGGISGYIKGNLSYCYNKAAVRGRNNAGGVTGCLEGTAEYCINSGKTDALQECAGGIAAQNKGTISNCVNRGSVGGTVYSGGISGLNGSGTTTRCVNEGIIGGNSYIGGISGLNSGTIVNCCNMCSVECTGSYAGGITGGNTGSVSLCYNVGKISGWAYIGGIAGTDSSELKNCYYLVGCATDDDDTPQSGVGAGALGTVTEDIAGRTARLTENSMKIRSSFKGFDFDNNWAFVYETGCDYPQLRRIAPYCDRIWDGTSAEGFSSGNGTEEDPYLIETAEQLAYFSDTVRNGNNYSGKFIKLGFDIFLNDTANLKNWSRSAPDNTWTPIGSYENGFNGTFDGDGYTVSGIYIDNGNDYQGLFGYADKATVKNLGVVSSYISGGNYSGGIAGLVSDISDCYNAGNVCGKVFVGGIAGKCGSINGSYNAGSIAGSTYTGALAGSVNSESINNCYYLSGCAKDGADVLQQGAGSGTQGVTTPDAAGRSTVLSAAEMKKQASYTGFDFSGKWTINRDKNNGMPYLLRGIRIRSLPDRLTYAVDDAFDTTGLAISDPAGNLAFSGFTTVPAQGYVFNANDIGSKEVKVSCKEKECSFTLTVENKDHFTAIYRVNGEVHATYENIKVGEKVPFAEEPNLKGYIFDGWSPNVPSKMPAYDLVMDAVFSPIKYTVNFYYNTTLLYKFSVFYDATGVLSCPNLPERTGYAFNGWSSKNNGKKEFEDGAEFINLASVSGEEVNFYAVWRLRKYTVNLYDGTELLESFTLYYSESETLHSDKIKERSGYTLMGWLKNNGGSLIPDNTEFQIMNEADGAVINYYTYWEQNPVLTAGDVTVEFSPKVLSNKAELNVETITSGAAVNIINNDHKGMSFTVYKIEAMVNGSSVQPIGDVAFKIKLPSSYDKEGCKLFYVDTVNGKLTEVPCEIKNGSFVFNSRRFGTYAVIDMNSAYKLEISGYKSSIKVDYKTTVTFSYIAEKLPEDAEVHWFIGGKDMGTGGTYTVKKAKKNYTVQLKALDKKGEVIAESEVETVNVKQGFFAKLVAFFRSIFGLLPKITQK
ncbi:MAG: InlB B-repeat-containing protein [Clostridiales bacterium]|nr:InlB B-repeat-containing protein [Clostridiales bacterium]